VVKALGYAAFVLGLAGAVPAGLVLWAALSDFRARGCPGAVQCDDAVGVMVLTACALLASLVMMFAGVVLVRR
jgi:hypothetical protein